jgi:hypothetical protein
MLCILTVCTELNSRLCLFQSNDPVIDSLMSLIQASDATDTDRQNRLTTIANELHKLRQRPAHSPLMLDLRSSPLTDSSFRASPLTRSAGGMLLEGSNRPSSFHARSPVPRLPLETLVHSEGNSFSNQSNNEDTADSEVLLKRDNNLDSSDSEFSDSDLSDSDVGTNSSSSSDTRRNTRKAQSEDSKSTSPTHTAAEAAPQSTETDGVDTADITTLRQILFKVTAERDQLLIQSQQQHQHSAAMQSSTIQAISVTGSENMLNVQAQLQQSQDESELQHEQFEHRINELLLRDNENAKQKQIEIEQLNVEVKQRDDEIQSLKSQLEVFERKVSETTSQLQLTNQKLDMSESKLVRLQSLPERTESVRFVELEQQNSMLQMQAFEIQSAFTLSTSTLESTITELNAKVQTFQFEMSQAQSHESDMKEEISKLKADLEAAQKEVCFE